MKQRPKSSNKGPVSLWRDDGRDALVAYGFIEHVQFSGENRAQFLFGTGPDLLEVGVALLRSVGDWRIVVDYITHGGEVVVEFYGEIDDRLHVDRALLDEVLFDGVQFVEQRFGGVGDFGGILDESVHLVADLAEFED